MSEVTGVVPFTVHGETFETWYKVLGDLRSGSRPLVILHGGPAVPGVYLEAHSRLFTSFSIPLIFYDQLGCGGSTHLRHKPKDFWTVELFMTELDNIISHFDIAHNFDLLGHSWGAMLAADYVATRQPKGLRRLVLANGPASMELYIRCAQKLMASARYPPGFADMMKRHEEERTMDSEDYERGQRMYTRNHICTVDPLPQALQYAFKLRGEDPTVNQALFGDYELSCNGNLADWSVIDRLHTIACPTLTINGVEDTAQDECVLPFSERMPRVRWIRFANSSHMPWFEEEEAYFRDLGAFLTSLTV